MPASEAAAIVAELRAAMGKLTRRVKHEDRLPLSQVAVLGALGRNGAMTTSGRGHAFRNTADEPARHLVIASPAEAMTMIEELTQAAREHIAEVLERYDSHLA